MCGIFGAIDLRGRFDRESYDRFVTLTDLISYRGPDDSGYLALTVGDNSVSDSESFDVFLGSRRLSILDLSSAGHQPMTDGLGRWIVFNGEIFNFIELRRDLELRGHKFKSGTDTEVILHIYQEYGEQGFDRLNGMWAFAITDLARRSIILSRDRFSIKPLYFTNRGDGKFFFASEVKQLLPLLDSVDVNADVMMNFLGQKLLDHSPETFFKGINRLEPKTNLVISLEHHSLSAHRYWDFPKTSPRTSSDPVAEFRELLIDSTAIRLRSDVPTGLLLSGGLDSSALAATSATVIGDGFDAYSIVSGDASFSEEKYIDEVTCRFRLNTKKILFVENEALEALDQVLYHNDEPFAGFSIVAQFKMLQAIKEHSRAVVLLSGQGGDEVLLGYLKYYFFYLNELLRQHKYVKAFTQAFFSAIRRTVLWQFRLDLAKRYIPALKNRGLHYLRNVRKEVPIWQSSSLTERQILDIDRYSVPALTHYEDRNAMAHSLEIRHPFLDHRLVEFVVGLPPEHKLRNGWTKRILRDSLTELPPDVRWRRDKGYFLVPEEEWLRTTMNQFILQTFSDSVLDKMGFIDRKIFLDTYAAFRDGRSGVSYTDISRTMVAELWARKFLHSPGISCVGLRN
jgi:asparagine synthase (glutamine-hydrolysing)